MLQVCQCCMHSNAADWSNSCCRCRVQHAWHVKLCLEVIHELCCTIASSTLLHLPAGQQNVYRSQLLHRSSVESLSCRRGVVTCAHLQTKSPSCITTVKVAHLHFQQGSCACMHHCTKSLPKSAVASLTYIGQDLAQYHKCSLFQLAKPALQPSIVGLHTAAVDFICFRLHTAIIYTAHTRCLHATVRLAMPADCQLIHG